MKPSDISLLSSFPPLVDTMGRTECEMAAALIVRACQLRGDEWAPVRPADIGEAFKHDLPKKLEPITSMNENPFCRPDFHGLVSRGFARWIPGDRPEPIELTEEGLAALKKHATRNFRERDLFGKREGTTR